ncbi:MAG TPA: invasion associated locus B family protein [Stellaceae bacterium]|nr:invasion associated locus B family protein [Stellaceae bacterium]
MMRRPLFLFGGILLPLLVSLALPGHAAARHRHHAAAHRHAAAASPTNRLGSFLSWSAYDYKGESGLVCYLIGEPRKSEPPHMKRKAPMAMVTHRPGEKVFNVVSFVEGTPLKKGSDVTLDINGKTFTMFTNGDSAWSRTAELDKDIVAAMSKGKTAVVKGTPEKGPETVDTYSLAGFSRALALIDKACGVKR